MNGAMKILIAYDGSECADAALADLQRAGLPSQAEATVISIADVWLWSIVGDEAVMPVVAQVYADSWNKKREEAAMALEQARALAMRAGENLQTIFPGWAVHAEGYADSPAWGIIKKADEWNPDLIVVGSHGRSAFGRFFLGSVSQKVVTHARCPVRVARGQIEKGVSPVRIVIGVDGSAYAQVAVEAVAKRIWPGGSEALIVAVPELAMMTSLAWLEEFYEDERASADKIVEAAAEKLRGSTLSVSTLVKEGDPKRVIIDEAERWQADSIFVGARGLKAVERFLLGSVSAAIAARAHCSVEVIRSAQTNQ